MIEPVEEREAPLFRRQQVSEGRTVLSSTAIVVAVLVTSLLVSTRLEGAAADASYESARNAGGDAAVRGTERPSIRSARGRGSIVFVSSRAGRRELTILDPTTGRLFPLPQSDRAADPTWSPSRAAIAFYRYDVDVGETLGVINADGTGLRRVPTLILGDLTTSCVCPAWSPNGRWLAYGFGYDGIALRNLRTQRNRVLVCPRHECGQEGARAPGWSPDSAWVTYWETQYPILESARVRSQRTRFRLPSQCFLGGYPDNYKAADWSPDGRWLLIVTKAVWKVPVERCRNRNTPRRARKLAGGEDAVWSPDGTKIAFVSARDGDREIYVMRSDGSHQRRLTNNTWADVEPDW